MDLLLQAPAPPSLRIGDVYETPFPSWVSLIPVAQTGNGSTSAFSASSSSRAGHARDNCARGDEDACPGDEELWCLLRGNGCVEFLSRTPLAARSRSPTPATSHTFESVGTLTALQHQKVTSLAASPEGAVIAFLCKDAIVRVFCALEGVVHDVPLPAFVRRQHLVHITLQCAAVAPSKLSAASSSSSSPSSPVFRLAFSLGTSVCIFSQPVSKESWSRYRLPLPHPTVPFASCVHFSACGSCVHWACVFAAMDGNRSSHRLLHGDDDTDDDARIRMGCIADEGTSSSQQEESNHVLPFVEKDLPVDGSIYSITHTIVMFCPATSSWAVVFHQRQHERNRMSRTLPLTTRAPLTLGSSLSLTQSTLSSMSGVLEEESSVDVCFLSSPAANSNHPSRWNDDDVHVTASLQCPFLDASVPLASACWDPLGWSIQLLWASGDITSISANSPNYVHRPFTEGRADLLRGPRGLKPLQMQIFPEPSSLSMHAFVSSDTDVGASKDLDHSAPSVQHMHFYVSSGRRLISLRIPVPSPLLTSFSSPTKKAPHFDTNSNNSSSVISSSTTTRRAPSDETAALGRSSTSNRSLLSSLSDPHTPLRRQLLFKEDRTPSKRLAPCRRDNNCDHGDHREGHLIGDDGEEDVLDLDSIHLKGLSTMATVEDSSQQSSCRPFLARLRPLLPASYATATPRNFLLEACGVHAAFRCLFASDDALLEAWPSLASHVLLVRCGELALVHSLKALAKFIQTIIPLGSSSVNTQHRDSPSNGSGLVAVVCNTLYCPFIAAMLKRKGMDVVESTLEDGEAAKAIRALAQRHSGMNPQHSAFGTIPTPPSSPTQRPRRSTSADGVGIDQYDICRCTVTQRPANVGSCVFTRSFFCLKWLSLFEHSIASSPSPFHALAAVRMSIEEELCEAVQLVLQRSSHAERELCARWLLLPLLDTLQLLGVDVCCDPFVDTALLTHPSIREWMEREYGKCRSDAAPEAPELTPTEIALLRDDFLHCLKTTLLDEAHKQVTAMLRLPRSVASFLSLVLRERDHACFRSCCPLWTVAEDMPMETPSSALVSNSTSKSFHKETAEDSDSEADSPPTQSSSSSWLDHTHPSTIHSLQLPPQPSLSGCSVYSAKLASAKAQPLFCLLSSLPASTAKLQGSFVALMEDYFASGKETLSLSFPDIVPVTRQTITKALAKTSADDDASNINWYSPLGLVLQRILFGEGMKAVLFLSRLGSWRSAFMLASILKLPPVAGRRYHHEKHRLQKTSLSQAVSPAHRILVDFLCSQSFSLSSVLQAVDAAWAADLDTTFLSAILSNEINQAVHVLASAPLPVNASSADDGEETALPTNPSSSATDASPVCPIEAEFFELICASPLGCHKHSTDKDPHQRMMHGCFTRFAALVQCAPHTIPCLQSERFCRVLWLMRIRSVFSHICQRLTMDEELFQTNTSADICASSTPRETLWQWLLLFCQAGDVYGKAHSVGALFAVILALGADPASQATIISSLFAHRNELQSAAAQRLLVLCGGLDIGGDCGNGNANDLQPFLHEETFDFLPLFDCPAYEDFSIQYGALLAHYCEVYPIPLKMSDATHHAEDRSQSEEACPERIYRWYAYSLSHRKAAISRFCARATGSSFDGEQRDSMKRGARTAQDLQEQRQKQKQQSMLFVELPWALVKIADLLSCRQACARSRCHPTSDAKSLFHLLRLRQQGGEDVTTSNDATMGRPEVLREQSCHDLLAGAAGCHKPLRSEEEETMSREEAEATFEQENAPVSENHQSTAPRITSVQAKKMGKEGGCVLTSNAESLKAKQSSYVRTHQGQHLATQSTQSLQSSSAPQKVPMMRLRGGGDRLSSEAMQMVNELLATSTTSGDVDTRLDGHDGLIIEEPEQLASSASTSALTSLQASLQASPTRAHRLSSILSDGDGSDIDAVAHDAEPLLTVAPRLQASHEENVFDFTSDVAVERAVDVNDDVGVVERDSDEAVDHFDTRDDAQESPTSSLQSSVLGASLPFMSVSVARTDARLPEEQQQQWEAEGGWQEEVTEDDEEDLTIIENDRQQDVLPKHGERCETREAISGGHKEAEFKDVVVGAAEDTDGYSSLPRLPRRRQTKGREVEESPDRVCEKRILLRLEPASTIDPAQPLRQRVLLRSHVPPLRLVREESPSNVSRTVAVTWKENVKGNGGHGSKTWGVKGPFLLRLPANPVPIPTQPSHESGTNTEPREKIMKKKKTPSSRGGILGEQQPSTKAPLQLVSAAAVAVRNSRSRKEIRAQRRQSKREERERQAKRDERHARQQLLVMKKQTRAVATACSATAAEITSAGCQGIETVVDAAVKGLQQLFQEQKSEGFVVTAASHESSLRSRQQAVESSEANPATTHARDMGSEVAQASQRMPRRDAEDAGDGRTDKEVVRDLRIHEYSVGTQTGPDEVWSRPEIVSLLDASEPSMADEGEERENEAVHATATATEPPPIDLQMAVVVQQSMSDTTERVDDVPTESGENEAGKGSADGVQLPPAPIRLQDVLCGAMPHRYTDSFLSIKPIVLCSEEELWHTRQAYLESKRREHGLQHSEHAPVSAPNSATDAAAPKADALAVQGSAVDDVLAKKRVEHVNERWRHEHAVPSHLRSNLSKKKSRAAGDHDGNDDHATPFGDVRDMLDVLDARLERVGRVAAAVDELRDQH